MEGLRGGGFASDEEEERIGERGLERLAGQIHVRRVGREHVYDQ